MDAEVPGAPGPPAAPPGAPEPEEAELEEEEGGRGGLNLGLKPPESKLISGGDRNTPNIVTTSTSTT